MGIEFTEFAPKIIDQASTEFGVTYFLKDIAVIEFKEGTHIDFKAVYPTLKSIKKHYGNSKPFGIIANRINSYSISLLDLKRARQKLPNLVAYGIVSYNNATRMSAKIESSFCEWKDICFDNPYEGLSTIQKRIENDFLVTD